MHCAILSFMYSGNENLSVPLVILGFHHMLFALDLFLHTSNATP